MENVTLTVLGTPSGRDFGAIVSSSGGMALRELPSEEVIALFIEHGALLFRGFEPDRESFREFSGRFASRFTVYPGPTRTTVGDPADAIQTVNGSDRGLSFHSEFSWLPTFPHLCWFHCVKPPTEGGQTLLCDGARVPDELSPSTRSLLEQKRLRWTTQIPLAAARAFLAEDDVEGWIRQSGHEQTFSLDGDSVRIDYIVPALTRSRYGAHLVFTNSLLLWLRDFPHGPLFPRFEDGSQVPAEVLTELIRITDRHAVQVAWQSGDLLMFDNTRVMHGRVKLTHPEARVIHTRFGYAAF